MRLPTYPLVDLDLYVLFLEEEVMKKKKINFKGSFWIKMDYPPS